MVFLSLRFRQPSRFARPPLAVFSPVLSVFLLGCEIVRFPTKQIKNGIIILTEDTVLYLHQEKKEIDSSVINTINNGKYILKGKINNLIHFELDTL